MYIVYDKDELPAYVGTRAEVANFLEMTIGSFDSMVSRIKNGRRNRTRKGYMVYRV